MGEIVGESDTGDSNGLQHAFSYTPRGGMVDLGTLPGDDYSSARGVSNSGEIVGVSGALGGRQRGFSYTRSRGMVDLDTGDSSYFFVAGVNDSGEVIAGTTQNAIEQAFSYTPSHGITDLGTLPGKNASIANAVNDRGEIVGEGGNDVHDYHAVSYTRQTGLVDLGSLPGDSASMANGVSDRGQIVGTSGDPHVGLRRSPTRVRAGWSTSVPLPGGTYSSASGVNNRGEIVGSASVAGDALAHAVVWHLYTRRSLVS